MRVLIINTWYYPNLQGGAEHSVKILAENLIKYGIKAAVFSVDNKEKGLMKEIINDVIVYRSDGEYYNLYEAYFAERSIFRKIKDKYHEILNPSIKPHLLDTIEEFKPDVIHCNCISGISLKIFQIVKEKEIPVVLTLRNYFFIYPFDTDIIKNRLISNGFRFIHKLICKRYTRFVEAVTAPSVFALNEYISKDYFKKATIKKCVPNCVEYDRDKMIETIKTKSRRNDSEIHFLYAGWITESKGIKVLLSAFEKIKNPNINLTLCGRGDLEHFVENVADEDNRVEFLGKLLPEELVVEYGKADVLIAPSMLDETFGRVLIEGCVHGLPIVCSNKGGFPEIVESMNCGILYNANEPEELLSCMNKMIDRSNYQPFYKGMIDNIARYSVKNQINSFMEIYDEITEKV